MIGPLTGFDRDAGNREKRRKHGVTPAEIEELFGGSPAISVDVERSLAEERLRAVGRTRAGRFVFLVFTLRERDGETYVRPIGARHMRREEIEGHGRATDPDLRER